MLDRLVAYHIPIGPKGAFLDIMHRPFGAHFAKNRLPAVFCINVAAAYIERIGMSAFGKRIGLEIVFQRLIGGG